MKLVVADDEKWVRMTIKSVIPFKQLGITLAAEASNGLEALDLCKKELPDVLITDIRMPGLTGFELIQEIKAVLPNIKIIIISGYDDFEYAKTAIKLGVSDYLLKPVNQDEITQILSKVIEEIKSQNESAEEQKLIKDQYKSTLPIVFDNVLTQIITPNTLTSDNIYNNIKKCGVKFAKSHYSLLVFEPDDETLMFKQNNPALFKKTIQRVVRHYLGGITFSKPSVNNEIISIINHPQAIDNDYFKYAIFMCKKLFEKHFSSTLSVGISSSSSQIKRLPELYIEASTSLGLRFYKGPGETTFFEKNIISESISVNIPDNEWEKLLFSIKFLDLIPVNQFIDNLLKTIQNRESASVDAVTEFCWSILQTIITRLNIHMPFIDYYTSMSGTQPYNKIKGIKFMSDLSVCVKEMIQSISTYYSSKEQGNNMNPVEIVKNIIDQNYSSDIGLEQVAKYVHLNPTYFSELFKKELGMSFVDYKMNVRIENAKRLIKSTDLNIYEVSEKIGYSDPKYFSKLFKKVTGMTPFEYKESSKKG